MLRGIQKGATRRLARLKGAAEFSQTVTDVVRTIYPKQKTMRIRNAVLDESTKTASLYTISKAVASRLFVDRELIRAALRKEGMDIRKIVVK